MYTCMESVVHFASLRVVPIYRKERHNVLYVMRAHVFWEKKKKKREEKHEGPVNRAAHFESKSSETPVPCSCAV